MSRSSSYLLTAFLLIGSALPAAAQEENSCEFPIVEQTQLHVFDYAPNVVSEYLDLRNRFDLMTVHAPREIVDLTLKRMSEIEIDVGDAFNQFVDDLNRKGSVVLVYQNPDYPDHYTDGIINLVNSGYPIVKIDQSRFPMLYNANVIEGQNIQVVSQDMIFDYTPLEFIKKCVPDASITTLRAPFVGRD